MGAPGADVMRAARLQHAPPLRSGVSPPHPPALPSISCSTMGPAIVRPALLAWSGGLRARPSSPRLFVEPGRRVEEGAEMGQPCGRPSSCRSWCSAGAGVRRAHSRCCRVSE
ncbi:hypothetical protein SETIT_9G160000v2 [Setaria italica]|uniref:Uncharacterized protein n=1 Tax=Setaria italica TaxID=4555 RepID=A0A368SH42_SETIT|nr:hypothetical protein SETIT_9G160000v2 [Setaria italica]